ncbi:MAG: hypothetical protein ABEI86_14615 [Halobacteriaceae archaeon]
MQPETLIPENPNRQGGILGKAQRKYLLGDPPSYDKSRVHQRIREDLIHSLLDASLLTKIPDKELGLVVDTLRDNTVEEDAIKRRLMESGVYEGDLDIGTGYSSDSILAIPEGIFGYEKGGYRRINTNKLDEAVIDMLAFLFRIVEQEQKSVDSFIEEAIPEAYRRFQGEGEVEVEVKIEHKNRDN